MYPSMKYVLALWSLLLSSTCITVFAANTVTSTKTVQEIDANGNITNKTYVTRFTTSSVSDIKKSLVATSVQNEVLLFDAIQDYRKSNKNKNILKYSSKLAWVARDYAKELSTNNYFSHTSKNGENGRARLDKGGMKENTFRWEVLAQAVDPKQALDAFKSSKSHNAILLEDKNYTIIWVGYYQGTRVVMLFADKNGKYLDKTQPVKSTSEKKSTRKKKVTFVPKIVNAISQWIC